MSDNIFPTNPVAIDVTRYMRNGNAGSRSTVRVYRSSPDRVSLQIRGEKSYATAQLPFDLAKKIARALMQEAHD